MKKFTQLLVTAIIGLMVCTQVTKAQNTFTVTRATNISYNTIAASGSSVTWQLAANADDNTSNEVAIPFSFSFMGNSFSKLWICTNGWLSFKSTTSRSFTNNLSVADTLLDSIITPYWDDLVVKGSLVANLSTSIKYETQGTAPNRVFIVEWIGMERFGQLGPNLNFQARLYETSNIIEMVYGTMDQSNSSFTYSLGLRSNNANYIAQQKHNTDYFTENSGGSTQLVIAPLCNTKITYTPAATFSAGSNPPATAPVNDESAGAITLPVNNGVCTNSCNIYYISENATASSGITVCSATTPGTPDDDVWFKFVATQTTSTVTVTGCGGYNPVIQAFDNALTSLSCINATPTGGGTETMNLTGLTVGNTYYIRVYHAATGNGTTQRFSICVSGSVAAPANDNCSGAVALTVGNGFCTNPVTGTLVGATASTGAPSFTCGSSTLTQDVWYSVLVTSGQTVTVQTSAVSNTVGNNMLLQVIRSSNNACGGTLTSKACDDNNNNDAVSDLMSRVTFTNSGPSDSTYFLRVIANENIDISDFAICAWNSGITKPIATGSNCIDGSINIDSAYKYTWVPLTDASGNIIAEIFPNGNKMGNTTYSYYVNSGAIRTGSGGRKYLDRNITITPTTQPSSAVQVRLYYKSSELDLLQVADPAVTSNNINVTKTTNTCANSANTIASGIFLPQIANGVYNGIDSFAVVNTPSFSTFFMHGGTTVITLPLHWLSINGNLNSSKQAVITFKVNETNVANYSIEKSADGRTFTNIGNMSSKGNGENTYSFTEATALQGTGYYRIKQIDADGRYSYSSIIKLANQLISTLAVYPNPVKDVVTISGAKLGGTIMLTDIGGKVVQQIKITHTTFTIDMSKYSNGLYILKSGNGVAQKIVKQ